MSDARPTRSLAWWVRWLHTYVSMLGFLVVVFFGVTGLTLNHADWFEAGGERVREATGNVDARWLSNGGDDAAIDRLAIVESLRAAHGLRGGLSEFRIADDECVVVFKGPGYSADAVIERATGGCQVTETHKGAMALLDDLHKGRDSGAVWSWVVDVSAVVVAIAGLTGIWLLCYLKKRRVAGLLVAAVGAVLPVAVWWVWVP